MRGNRGTLEVCQMPSVEVLFTADVKNTGVSFSFRYAVMARTAFGPPKFPTTGTIIARLHVLQEAGRNLPLRGNLAFPSASVAVMSSEYGKVAATCPLIVPMPNRNHEQTKSRPLRSSLES